MRANVPSRKKIKIEWFKSKAQFTIERKVSIEYNASSVNSNKINHDVIIKYVMVKEGEPKALPSNSPMTLYKRGLPFLFLSTSGTIGNKIISEELIDDDIKVYILSIKGNQVRIGVEAPKEIEVHREEIYEKIQREKEQKVRNIIISDNKDIITKKSPNNE